MVSKKKHESDLVEDYKIKAGRAYFVKRQEYGDKVFYKIPLRKVNQDGTFSYCYKNVIFMDKPDIPNNSKIIPIKFIEDFHRNPKDFYNAIFTLVITQWKYAEEENETDVDQALQDYEEFLNKN